MIEQYKLSEMTRKNFSKAANEIYLLTDYNHDQYPDYWKWYYEKSLPRVIEGTGEMIFCLDGFTIAGLSILKKDPLEQKICTLLIHEEYRKKGYSQSLLESSFDYLGTEKPLITIPTKRLEEFSKFIQAYNWQEVERTDKYYSEEIIFNQVKKLTKK